MSSTEDTDMKGGHAPAVKAGGMRIVQHKHKDSGEQAPTKEEEKKDEEEYGPVEPKTDKHHQSILLSGAITKGDQDFPPEAIKSYHNKPVPTHDCRPVQKPHNIQQPR